MTITMHLRGPVTVLYLQGKLMEEADAAELRETIKQSLIDQRSLIVIDFEGVDWVNSTGLGVLVAVYHLVREAGGKLVLSSLNRTVEQVINMSKLNLVFEIQPSVAEAERKIQGRQVVS